tara:strand:- start:622 stop:867 length:246 start_codon:yes stop_codon:yes gene_type:complete
MKPRCCDCKEFIKDGYGFMHPYFKKAACKYCAGRRCVVCGKWVHVKVAVLIGQYNVCLECNQTVKTEDQVVVNPLVRYGRK